MFDPARHLASHAHHAWLRQLDPRARILAALGFAVVVAVSDRLTTLVAALAASLVAAVFSGISARVLLRRLMPLNLFLLLVVAVVPLGTPGTTLATLGPLEYSLQGLHVAVAVALKANAILLMLAVLVGTIDLTHLGHALHHLYVPEKLIHLFLFTVRYLGVLGREYGRLRGAMKCRGFRPRMNRHTYRTYGYLIGMLLVRSLDRSERILAAMKCRGFRGHFYLLDHFKFSRRDAPFVAAAATVFLILGLAEWL